MIDDKTALQWELDAEEAGLTQHAEIIRHARRYLVLREKGVSLLRLIGDDLDAVADRLLEKNREVRKEACCY